MGKDMVAKKIVVEGMAEDELRDLVAWRITEARKKKYPGRGGAKRCAEEIGIVYQQWSQYENAARTPRWEKLRGIAKFFGVPEKRFITPPDGWEQKRPEWKNRNRPGKMSRLRVEVEAAQAAQPHGPENPAPEPAAAGKHAWRAPMHTAILRIIDNLIQIDKWYERGEIPTPVYEQTIEAISRFMDLAHASRTEK